MSNYKITSSTIQYIGICFFLASTAFLFLMILMSELSLYVLFGVLISIILLFIYLNAVRIDVNGKAVWVKKIYSKAEKFDNKSLKKVTPILGQLCYITFTNGRGYFFLGSSWDYIQKRNYSEYVCTLIRDGKVNDR